MTLQTRTSLNSEHSEPDEAGVRWKYGANNFKCNLASFIQLLQSDQFVDLYDKIAVAVVTEKKPLPKPVPSSSAAAPPPPPPSDASWEADSAALISKNPLLRAA